VPARVRRIVRPRRRIGASPHAYFNTLKALPSAYRWASLRTPGVAADWNCGTGLDSIDGLTGNPPNLDVTYDATEDAAKALWSTDYKDLQQQVRVNLDRATPQDVILTWDVMYDAGWALDDYGGNVQHANLTHKSYQISAGRAGSPNADKLWLETRARYWTGAEGYACTSNNRFNGSNVIGVGIPVPTIGTSDPVAPRGPGAEATDDRPIAKNVWHRYVHRLKYQLLGSDSWWDGFKAAYPTHTMVDTDLYWSWEFWIITAAGGVFKRLDKVPCYAVASGQTWDRIDQWWIEHNTSSEMPGATGTIRFTGTPGTLIPNNTAVLRGDGGTHQTIGDQNIGGGGFVDIPCDTTTAANNGGSKSNSTSGTAFTLQTPITNVDNACTSVTDFTGGLDHLSTPTPIWQRNFVCLTGYGDPDATILSTQGL
jgi:hypothetical protein